MLYAKLCAQVSGNFRFSPTTPAALALLGVPATNFSRCLGALAGVRMESGQLEILFWLPTPEIFPRFRVASLPVSIHLRPGDVVLRYRRMI